MNNRKEKVLAYMETVIPAGVYQIRNTKNGKMFISAAPNLDGAWNRNKFQLELGSHPSKQLQADWKQYGEEAFSYEVLEQLKRKEGERSLSAVQRDQLKKMEESWIARVEGADLYTKFK